jgi:hypothetical protein
VADGSAAGRFYKHHTAANTTSYWAKGYCERILFRTLGIFNLTKQATVIGFVLTDYTKP